MYNESQLQIIYRCDIILPSGIFYNLGYNKKSSFDDNLHLVIRLLVQSNLHVWCLSQGHFNWLLSPGIEPLTLSYQLISAVSAELKCIIHVFPPGDSDRSRTTLLFVCSKENGSVQNLSFQKIKVVDDWKHHVAVMFCRSPPPGGELHKREESPHRAAVVLMWDLRPPTAIYHLSHSEAENKTYRRETRL